MLEYQERDNTNASIYGVHVWGKNL
jgi:hypothetical protein